MWFSLFAVAFVCIVECFLLKSFRAYRNLPECVLRRDRGVLVVAAMVAALVLVVAGIL